MKVLCSVAILVKGGFWLVVCGLVLGVVLGYQVGAAVASPAVSPASDEAYQVARTSAHARVGTGEFTGSAVVVARR